MAEQSAWAGRFVAAAIVQGGIAFAILSGLVLISALQMNPSPGRIVAGGDYCSVTVTLNTTTGNGTRAGGTSPRGSTCSWAGWARARGVSSWRTVGTWAEQR